MKIEDKILAVRHKYNGRYSCPPHYCYLGKDEYVDFIRAGYTTDCTVFGMHIVRVELPSFLEVGPCSR